MANIVRVASTSAKKKEYLFKDGVFLVTPAVNGGTIQSDKSWKSGNSNSSYLKFNYNVTGKKIFAELIEYGGSYNMLSNGTTQYVQGNSATDVVVVSGAGTIKNTAHIVSVVSGTGIVLSSLWAADSGLNTYIGIKSLWVEDAEEDQ